MRSHAGAIAARGGRPLGALLWLVAIAAAGEHAMAASGGVKGTITTAAGAPVANAAVLIEGPSGPRAGDLRRAVMEQRREAFNPRVLVVPVGTTVEFPNSDPKLHNVFSNSPPKRFDLGMYDQGETKSVVFDTPGVVAVRCKVHASMDGFVVVHDNPYGGVSDDRGTYTITGVPPGSYDVRIWHERLPEKRLRVTIREGQVQPLDAQLDGERATFPGSR
jgi:plastocyanin